jgi:hypothetical protein
MIRAKRHDTNCKVCGSDVSRVFVSVVNLACYRPYCRSQCDIFHDTQIRRKVWALDDLDGCSLRRLGKSLRTSVKNFLVRLRNDKLTLLINNNHLYNRFLCRLWLRSTEFEGRSVTTFSSYNFIYMICFENFVLSLINGFTMIMSSQLYRTIA